MLRSREPSSLSLLALTCNSEIKTSKALVLTHLKCIDDFWWHHLSWVDESLLVAMGITWCVCRISFQGSEFPNLCGSGLL